VARNRFTNPANGDFYDWAINHDEEEANGKTRTISRTAPTGNVGLVKQQGDDGPFLLKLSGKITSRSQFSAFWAWYALCRTQTIVFKDFDAQEYEVQITSFLPQRHRTLMRAGKNPGNYYWTYSMEMEVYRFVSGDMAASGVTP
jgi:hypothetical protein